MSEYDYAGAYEKIQALTAALAQRDERIKELESQLAAAQPAVRAVEFLEQQRIDGFDVTIEQLNGETYLYHTYARDPVIAPTVAAAFEKAVKGE